MEGFSLCQARLSDLNTIWPIFEDGIAKRKGEGSLQWQDGYPNEGVVRQDIEQGNGYVALDSNGKTVGYIALIFDVEPAYELLEGGEWLSEGLYAVVHRLVVSQRTLIKGLASWMLLEAEEICKLNQIFSIKADTNFDNGAMLRVFEKLGYRYCGIVYFRQGARQAFEKILVTSDQ